MGNQPVAAGRESRREDVTTKAVFAKLQKNENGEVVVRDILAAAAVPIEDFEEVLASFSIDVDGTINEAQFQEILTYVINKSSRTPVPLSRNRRSLSFKIRGHPGLHLSTMSELFRLFNAIDQDKDGKISPDALAALIGAAYDSADEIIEKILLIDQDEIDFGEFLNVMLQVGGQDMYEAMFLALQDQDEQRIEEEDDVDSLPDSPVKLMAKLTSFKSFRQQGVDFDSFMAIIQEEEDHSATVSSTFTQKWWKLFSSLDEGKLGMVPTLKLKECVLQETGCDRTDLERRFEEDASESMSFPVFLHIAAEFDPSSSFDDVIDSNVGGHFDNLSKAGKVGITDIESYLTPLGSSANMPLLFEVQQMIERDSSLRLNYANFRALVTRFPENVFLTSHPFDTEVQTALQDLFADIDTRKAGAITVAELAVGLKISSKKATDLMALADVSDASGLMNVDSFVEIMTKSDIRLDHATAQELEDQKLFILVDKDSDGYISANDLASSLAIPRESAEQLVATNDLDGDSALNLEEFASLVKNPAMLTIREREARRVRHRSLFLKLDTDMSGTVSVEELATALGMEKFEIVEILSRWTTDPVNNELDVTQFVGFMEEIESRTVAPLAPVTISVADFLPSGPRVGTFQARPLRSKAAAPPNKLNIPNELFHSYHDIFSMIDTNGDGIVTETDLAQALSIPLLRAQTLVQSGDSGGTNSLNFPDFVKIVSNPNTDLAPPKLKDQVVLVCAERSFGVSVVHSLLMEGAKVILPVGTVAYRTDYRRALEGLFFNHSDVVFRVVDLHKEHEVKELLSFVTTTYERLDHVVFVAPTRSLAVATTKLGVVQFQAQLSNFVTAPFLIAKELLNNTILKPKGSFTIVTCSQRCQDPNSGLAALGASATHGLALALLAEASVQGVVRVNEISVATAIITGEGDGLPADRGDKVVITQREIANALLNIFMSGVHGRSVSLEYQGDAAKILARSADFAPKILVT
eukprot:c19641_g2_i3.p1 GENE.c19641_g2_i3~~c19641_g2_i3.p1  ORF type:complete len:983 (+),score=278.69 c19641_g2_i3:203-3151(+)